MVAVVLVALGVDHRPQSEGDLRSVFGIVGAYVFLLLAIQRLDIEAAYGPAARSSSIAPGTTIDNPMTVPEPDLWAALATSPKSVIRRSARTDSPGARP